MKIEWAAIYMWRVLSPFFFLPLMCDLLSLVLRLIVSAFLFFSPLVEESYQMSRVI